jgi:hypothetical protein
MSPSFLQKSSADTRTRSKIEHTVGDEFDVPATTTSDEVFGDINEDGPNYRDVSVMKRRPY